MSGIDIDEVRRFNVHPGETLVVTLPDGARPEDMARIRDTLTDSLPDGVKLLLLGPGIQLGVVTTVQPQDTQP